MKILVTGCAGFIGYHLCYKLIKNKKNKVYGLDDINNYYDVNLKKNRLKNLSQFNTSFKFEKESMDGSSIEAVYAQNKICAY